MLTLNSKEQQKKISEMKYNNPLVVDMNNSNKKPKWIFQEESWDSSETLLQAEHCDLNVFWWRFDIKNEISRNQIKF